MNVPDAFSLGWDERWEETASALVPAGCISGRVAAVHGALLRVLTPGGEYLVSVPGAFRRQVVSPWDLPAVGDWIAFTPAPSGSDGRLAALLPRRTVIARRHPHSGEPQILAANVDTALVMAALDGEFQEDRLERYLVAVRQGGADPVIVLNKSDRCPNPEVWRRRAESVATGAPVCVISALCGHNLESLGKFLRPGRTAVVLGSSGVGKSTLLNALAGRPIARTGELPPGDHRGRHTTTTRELFLLPRWGAIIDSPGLRTLQPCSEEGMEEGFRDVESLARQCRFSDCSHSSEPGCAVREAVASGKLPRRRLESYRKLHREARLGTLEPR